jgi:hypothetical protein
MLVAVGTASALLSPQLLLWALGGGAVVSGGVMLHALLHGLESPADASNLSWWAGALFRSVLVCGGTCLLLFGAGLAV